MTLAQWNFDLAHSAVEFSVRHMLVSKVRGRFTKWSGKFELDENDITRSRIDVASIDTHDAKLDEHPRSGDFFEAEKHPKITFKSKSVTSRGRDKLVVRGDLTIRGAAREVEFAVERNGVVEKDPRGMRQ